MKLTVKYFGAIKEITALDEEIFSVNESKSLGEFKKTLIAKYPLIEKHQFRIAINTSIEQDNFMLNSDCVVALLPPFAGG